MEVKLFQKTQRDLAAYINLVIDKYWDDFISEQEMVDLIQKLYINNEDKFKRNGKYTTVLRQQCGKRRLNVVSKVLDTNADI
ncbi:TIGR04540 family protein [Aquibacillus sp. 3ASR75-11]|uniref:TIGR04540 family protein n=1 Tax=Terrihalobacillus insolitus TaxID=2950438 RepID=A0A9X4AMY2_9BACI|nr:TIGR04540 family protein [Terrihalobacillus insolitus]MDC3415109.1 TIGR04540 family protein [Terrihalobacillus insolitus]MDC3425831.1 TIGR04540 family protein [Terrihalobacillus insolitus]